MANLPELNQWDPGVYQLELTDPVQGGVGGKSNSPLINLANRTVFLKARVDALIAGVIDTVVPDATELVKGKVMLATSVDAVAGVNTTKAVTPAGVKAAMDGVAAGVLLGIYARVTAGAGLTANRPSGATRALICVQGGGGGGTEDVGSGAGYGGSGAYAEAFKVVTGDLTVTVGGGGIGGMTGSSGGASSVAGDGFTTIVAAGGGGGTSAVNGQGGATPATGDLNVPGVDGEGLGGGDCPSFIGHDAFGNGKTGLRGGGGGGGANGGPGMVIIYWYK